jgi:hypothetical protein
MICKRMQKIKMICVPASDSERTGYRGNQGKGNKKKEAWEKKHVKEK